jgi:hypothetical protein
MGHGIRRIAVLAGVLLVLTTVAGAEDAMPLRSFDRFELDTGTARGLWLEAGSFLIHNEVSASFFGVMEKDSVDVVTTAARIVYGSEHLEGGVFIPYVNIDEELSLNLGGGTTSTRTEDGIGDIRLYGKAIPLRSKWVDGGVGVELSLPSGDENKGLGAGEVGVLPYATAALHLGPIDLRGHVGHRSFAGDASSGVVDSGPLESWVYGGGLHGAVSRNMALRAEFVGETFDSDRVSGDAVLFEPGVDLRLPLGSVEIWLRPTGAVGISDTAPDWGVGGTIVLAWGARATP